MYFWCGAGLPDFSWYKIPKPEIMYQNEHKMYQIGIFGSKTNHLATLVRGMTFITIAKVTVS
jgi:hypothetical protein